ncbi:unnamed protein product [Orchesella dallaii]|uniref:Uncharacterized protein n=1 Tax=Orchesella dallaii TaxID=48710 RepID=A0ABP1R7R8_9HEXA
MWLSTQISVLLVIVLVYSLVPFTSAGIGLKIPYLSLQPAPRVPPTNQANPLQPQQLLAQPPKAHALLQQFMKLLPAAKLPNFLNPYHNHQHLKQQNIRPQQQNIRPHKPIRQPQHQLSSPHQKFRQPQQQPSSPHQQIRQPQQQPPSSYQQFPRPQSQQLSTPHQQFHQTQGQVQPNQLLPAQSDLNPHFHSLHSSSDQNGALYLHDPDSSVNFYFKENLYGSSKKVNIHHDGCRQVPTDYWHEKPKSLWAKHCIVLYQNGHCKGNGVQVAGMVSELRTAGLHYGVTSFRPCEKNIRIRFTSPHDNKLHHHNHDHHQHHHDQY